jgi:hypothetical protein
MQIDGTNDTHGLDPAVLIGVVVMLVAAKTGGEFSNAWGSRRFG